MTAVQPVVMNTSPTDQNHVPGYNSTCSINLGITLAVFAGAYVVLGIAELCLPHFTTAGCILYVPIVLVLAAVFGILAGKRLRRNYVVGSLVTNTIAAALTGITFALMIMRMTIVLLIIPIANSEMQYTYVHDHQYFPNGTIEEFDYDPERIPEPHMLVDYTATSIVMSLELVLALAAFVLSLILACYGCRPICCPKTPYQTQQVMLRQEDGTFVELHQPVVAYYPAQPNPVSIQSYAPEQKYAPH